MRAPHLSPIAAAVPVPGHARSLWITSHTCNGLPDMSILCMPLAASDDLIINAKPKDIGAPRRGLSDPGSRRVAALALTQVNTIHWTAAPKWPPPPAMTQRSLSSPAALDLGQESDARPAWQQY
jgi:hypothetical protein